MYFFFKNAESKLSDQNMKTKYGQVPLPITTGIRVRKDIPSREFSGKCKAGFPLGEFVRANKQKANVIGW